MSAPQTPAPCPDWCVERGKRHNLGDHCVHSSRFFGADEIAGGARPWIVQEWTEKDGFEAPVITLPSKDVIDVDATTARAFAGVIEHAHRGSPLAAALREAADELDRILGSST